MPSVLGDKEKPGEAGVSETAQVPSVRLTLRASCCPLGRRFLSSFAQGKREHWQVEMPCCCSATLYTTQKLPEREIGCRLLGKAQGRHCLGEVVVPTSSVRTLAGFEAPFDLFGSVRGLSHVDRCSWEIYQYTRFVWGVGFRIVEYFVSTAQGMLFPGPNC